MAIARVLPAPDPTHDVESAFEPSQRRGPAEGCATVPIDVLNDTAAKIPAVPEVLVPTLARLIEVRSQLALAVIAYLEAEARSACELPVYFPLRLRSPDVAPFGNVRQRVRVTDRTALERWHAQERAASFYSPRRDPSRDTLDWDSRVADHFGRAIVLGEPGSGKSWLLRWDAWRIANEGAAALEQRRDTGLDAIRLPVRVHLAELLQFVQQRLQRVDRLSRAEAVRDALVDQIVDRAEMALGGTAPATFRGTRVWRWS